MNSEIDIHNYKKRLESISRKIEFSEQISKANKELFVKFKNNCFSEGISVCRITRYLYCLHDIAVWLRKGLRGCNVEDIKGLVAKIEVMDKYAERTKYEYKMTLKKFYKWIRNKDHPKEISWIKLREKVNHQKLPEDILTEEEVKKLIESGYSTRDRALISALYESGCRIGEFIKIRIRDVEFDDFGIKLSVAGKTGSRKIRIVASVPYLQEWISRHPLNKDFNAFVWITESKNEMMGYASLRKVLQVLARRAGINKRVNPHNFRHSRATHLANYLTDAQMKEFFGWTQGSDMASVYVHLSGRDIDNAILQNVYGKEVKKKNEQKDVLIPKSTSCIRCREENVNSNKFCFKCGMPLNEEVNNLLIKKETRVKQTEGLMDELVKDEETVKFLLKKIMERGLGKRLQSIS